MIASEVSVCVKGRLGVLRGFTNAVKRWNGYFYSQIRDLKQVC